MTISRQTQQSLINLLMSSSVHLSTMYSSQMSVRYARQIQAASRSQPNEVEHDQGSHSSHAEVHVKLSKKLVGGSTASTELWSACSMNMHDSMQLSAKNVYHIGSSSSFLPIPTRLTISFYTRGMHLVHASRIA